MKRSTLLNSPSGRSGLIQTRPLALILACLSFWSLASSARGVITYADPGRQTQAPPYLLPWYSSGNFRSGGGVAIGPRHFITARHLGGSVGDTFRVHGETYTTMTQHVLAESDLTIWEVDTDFDCWTPVYEGSEELNKEVLLIGNGLDRGQPVYRDDQLIGWETLQGSGGPLSWGTNLIDEVVAFEGVGDTLLYEFNDPTENGEVSWSEGHLAVRDSGGGAFLRDETGQWFLAGIHYAATRVFSTNGDDSGRIDATIFDARGLYVQGGDGWVEVDADGLEQSPGFSLSTRLSTRRDWIGGVVSGSGITSVPEPGSGVLLLLGCLIGGILMRRNAGRICSGGL